MIFRFLIAQIFLFYASVVNAGFLIEGLDNSNVEPLLEVATHGCKLDALELNKEDVALLSSPNDVAFVLKLCLEKTRISEELEIEFLSDLSAPIKKEVTKADISMINNEIRSRTPFKLKINYVGGAIESVVWAKIKRWKVAPVALSDFEENMELKTEDVGYEYVDVSSLECKPIYSKVFIKMRASKKVDKGNVFCEENTEMIPDVEKNARLSLVIIGNGFKVVKKVIALQSGIIGESILVNSANSKAKLRARIVDKSTLIHERI